MKLKALIAGHNWLSIASELTRLYPEEEKQIDAYRDIFEHLRIMEAEPSDITIRLTTIENEGETYVDVDGYYTDGRVDKRSGSDALALDFTPWQQWLGMEVDQSAFTDFTELEIIAHCLYEMTFVSFDQQEIQSKMEDLERTIDEYKNMPPEERKANITTLEDLFADLDDDDDKDED